jgi:effector-binding domain-containing protein
MKVPAVSHAACACRRVSNQQDSQDTPTRIMEEAAVTEQLGVHWKRLDDMLIAGIRFTGGFDGIPTNFGKLASEVEPYITEKGFTLYHGGSAKTGYDIEVCFPVSEPVDTGDVRSRILEGEDVICAIHRGPYRSDDENKGIGATWGRLWRYTVDNHIGIAENACREVYLEDDIAHGDDSEQYITEIMMPLLLPKWLARLENGLDRLADPGKKAAVLGEGRRITSQSDPGEKVAWMKGLMERLDAAVPDEETRREIVCGCAHVYPETQIRKFKAMYQEVGGLEGFMARLEEDPGYEGARYYRDPERGDGVIFIDKVPQEAAKHKEAADPIVKRAAACHCPIIKAAILRGETISKTFCNCGTGWFMPLWEALLERPVRITCEESVLQGHDRCRFAIYVNDGS